MINCINILNKIKKNYFAIYFHKKMCYYANIGKLEARYKWEIFISFFCIFFEFLNRKGGINLMNYC